MFFALRLQNFKTYLHTAHWNKRENSTRYERKTQDKKTRDCAASAEE